MDVASPWKISAIEEGLGGRYDRETIIDMLQQCRGNIDTAFCNLLDEVTPAAESAGTAALETPAKALLQSSPSRSSSPFSTASKRSVDSSVLGDDDTHHTARHARDRGKKKRILPDVTVGIAFRNYQNDLVSLRLRLGPRSNIPPSPETTSADPESKGQSDDDFVPSDRDDNEDDDDETWTPENSDAHATIRRRGGRPSKTQHRVQ